MKIAILSHAEVASYYAANLMQRGHEITLSGGGAIHAPGLAPYLECDGCLLLGDEPGLREIADYMEAAGKKVWRHLTEIP
jgi:NADPH-dependent ferric siderophore reductase